MRQTVALFRNKRHETSSYTLVGSTIRQTLLRKVLLLPICIMFLETSMSTISLKEDAFYILF